MIDGFVIELPAERERMQVTQKLNRDGSKQDSPRTMCSDKNPGVF